MKHSRHPALLALSLVAGIIFALGLIISQMVNPAKVLNFLDLAGDWDPTLAFVMGGALMVTMPAFRFILKRPHPLLDKRFYLPTKADIDTRLLTGSAIFGVGWGIAGLCPGPALTALATGLLPVVGFVLAMAAGAYVFKLFFD
ncbi:YeeE/YedE family protein [Allohahella marinimesophila]|uniref:YeeE/YedE family protein n=1 Tax=Allohahella marinimesophila TaxID=1054972 RepID=A0ABP7P295_9GAMM